ncbi:MAG: hypothetical protein GX050_04205 [Firmicutes bacterium]|nr:hypothetical protein [Bacillota bacterium]
MFNSKLFVSIFLLLFTLIPTTPAAEAEQATKFKLTYEQLFPDRIMLPVEGEQLTEPAIPRRGSTPVPDYSLEQRVVPVPMPPEIRGVYATGWAAGSATLLNRILQFARETEINSLVVDIKDDTGRVSYRSGIPMVNALEAWEAKIENPHRLLQTLRRAQIYPIARLVVFKDPLLAERRPDLALKQKNGEIWRDYKGLAWVDPHSREVWEYNIKIAKEAVRLGFPEIQFDYVRFASDGDLRNCIYPFADGNSKEDVIKEFLLYARRELEPLGVVVSADIFGLACSAADDLFIGQKLEKIAEAVPVISPMVYPSHYAKGCYGLRNPDCSPYETVLKSLKDAAGRLEGYPVQLRPWLQDFSLESTYGQWEIQAQIQAVRDAGLKDWLFWNPSCRYQVSKYLPLPPTIDPTDPDLGPAEEEPTPVLDPAEQQPVVGPDEPTHEGTVLEQTAEMTTADPGEEQEASGAATARGEQSPTPEDEGLEGLPPEAEIALQSALPGEPVEGN